jgi:hypothetical protein
LAAVLGRCAHLGTTVFDAAETCAAIRPSHI